MATKILQIEDLTANTLLNKLDTLNNQIKDLKKQLETKDNDKYLSRTQTAKMLGVSFVTLYDWARKGIITPYKLGNKVFFKLSEIENAMTPQKKGGVL